MSTIYTVELYGKNTGLESSNADYDYTYGYLLYLDYNFKFDFKSSDAEFLDPLHIPPAIDQSSISGITEECSIIYGGSISQTVESPSVKLSGADLMDFIRTNSISLLNGLMIIKATIGGTTRTLFTGKISATEYTDQISMVVKSRADDILAQDPNRIVLTEDNAYGIDESNYGNVVNTVIGDGQLLKMYPITDMKSDAPSVTFEVGTNRGFEANTAYYSDGDGNPLMADNMPVIGLFFDGDTGLSVLDVSERYSLFSGFTDDFKYSDYMIEVISGKGKGKKYPIKKCIMNNSGGINTLYIYLDLRIEQDELNGTGFYLNVDDSTNNGTPHYCGVIAQRLIGYSLGNETAEFVYPQFSYKDYTGSSYSREPTPNNDISFVRLISKSPRFIIPRPQIDQGIDGASDTFDIDSVYSDECGEIDSNSYEIEVLSKTNETAEIKATFDLNESRDSLLVPVLYNTGTKLLKKDTYGALQLTSSGFYSTDNGFTLVTDNSMIVLADQSNLGDAVTTVFDGSSNPATIQTANITTFVRIDYSNVDLINLDSEIRLLHNLEMQNGAGTATIKTSLFVYLMSEEMFCSGYLKLDPIITLGATGFGVCDMVTDSYTNDDLKSLGGALLNSFDLKSQINQDKKPKYIMMAWQFEYISNSASGYMVVKMGNSVIKSKKAISLNSLYCTIKNKTGATAIEYPCDIARLILKYGGATINEDSFTAMRELMPKAVKCGVKSSGSISDALYSICRSTMLAIIRERDARYQFRWWVDDLAVTTPVRTLGNSDYIEGSIRITKNNIGYSSSNYRFKVTDYYGKEQSLAINTATSSSFPLESAWTTTGTAFTMATGDSIDVSLPSPYLLYKSGITAPLSGSPFVRGKVYLFNLGEFDEMRCRLVSWCWGSDGKAWLLFYRISGFESSTVTNGRAVYFSKSQADWQYLVSGSMVTGDDYLTAKNIWDLAHESYERLGSGVDAPSDVVNIGQPIFGDAMIAYITYLVKHNSYPKTIIEFDMPLTVANLDLTLLSYVTVQFGAYSANPVTGWVTRIGMDLEKAKLSFQVVTAENDENIFILNEQLASSETIIDESGSNPAFLDEGRIV